MEQLVYCQDQIYSVVLNKVREEVFNPVGKPSQNHLKSPVSNNTSSVSSINEIGVHLDAYFLVSVYVHRPGPCGVCHMDSGYPDGELLR